MIVQSLFLHTTSSLPFKPLLLLCRIKIISATGLDRPSALPASISASTATAAKSLLADALKEGQKLQQQVAGSKPVASASRLFQTSPKPQPAPVVASKEKKVEDVKEGDGLNFFQRLQPGCAAAAQAVHSQFQEQAGKALRQSLSVFANIRGKQREATHEHELAAVPASIQGTHPSLLFCPQDDRLLLMRLDWWRYLEINQQGRIIP